jgi:hypothetical protein
VVEETDTGLRIDDGELALELASEAFNLLDVVRLDGAPIIDNRDGDGHYLLNRFGHEHLDAVGCGAPAPLVVEVEEAGPLRVRVRVERPTYIVRDSDDPCFDTFPEAKDPVPGFVAWVDVIAGEHRVRVHHLTLNTGITAFRDGRPGDGMRGWPLFYREDGFRIHHALEGAQMVFGHDAGETAPSAMAVRALQETPDMFTVDGEPVAAHCRYADLSTPEGLGVLVVSPLCRETQPNGWSYEPGESELRVLSSPAGCDTCSGMTGPRYPDDLSPSALYVINDLSVQEHVLDLVFHSAPLGTEERAAEYLRARHPPAAVTTPAVYRALGPTTDLFGLLPTDLPERVTDPVVARDMAVGELHQQTLGMTADRFRSCGGGGIAGAQMSYLTARPPPITRQGLLLGDEIRRPQVPPTYWGGVDTPTRLHALALGPDILYPDPALGHVATELSASGYCSSGPIRPHNYRRNHSKYVLDKPFPSGFSTPITAYPRDPPHQWMQSIYDVPTDNPVAAHFKRAFETYLQSYALQLAGRRETVRIEGYDSESDAFPNAAVRGRGHMLITLADAYAESGDSHTLTVVSRMIATERMVQAPDGSMSDDGKVSFQDGYLMHGVLNAMMLVEPEHPVFMDGWAILFGTDTSEGLVNAVMGSRAGYYSAVGCTSCESSGSSTTIVDPMAVAALLSATLADPRTGRIETERAESIVAFLHDYLDGVLGGQPYFIDRPWRSHGWIGQSYGRSLDLLDRWPGTPPELWLDAAPPPTARLLE